MLRLLQWGSPKVRWIGLLPGSVLSFLHQQRAYQGERAPLALRGQTVILVDDGLATGYTIWCCAVRPAERACVHCCCGAGCSARSLEMLRAEVDDLVCVEVPRRMMAIGMFYGDFSQVTDEQVREALGR